MHAMNGFAEVSKNLTSYRFKNNFIGLSKQLCRTFKLITRMLKLFVQYCSYLRFLHNCFDPTKLFLDLSILTMRKNLLNPNKTYNIFFQY